MESNTHGSQVHHVARSDYIFSIFGMWGLGLSRSVAARSFRIRRRIFPAADFGISSM